MTHISASQANPQVDFYFQKVGAWQQEKLRLRTLILTCGLAEELKWGQPCYTFETHNVVLIHSFKEYCAVLFFKGALLSDAKGILVQQTENVQSARQMRFAHLKEIAKQEKNLKAYILEAIKVDQAGLKVVRKATAEFAMPKEFANQLASKPRLKKAFEALTPGRQRAYLLHFSAAKQAKTREARIEKYVQKILDGKGLDD